MVVSLFITLIIGALLSFSVIIYTFMLSKEMQNMEEIVKAKDDEIFRLQDELEKKEKAIKEYKSQIQKLQDEFVDSNVIYQELCNIKQSFAVLETELDVLHKVIRKLKDERDKELIEIIQGVIYEARKFGNTPYYTYRKYLDYLENLLKNVL